jgi:hypothetical protein
LEIIIERLEALNADVSFVKDDLTKIYGGLRGLEVGIVA